MHEWDWPTCKASLLGTCSMVGIKKPLGKGTVRNVETPQPDRPTDRDVILGGLGAVECEGGVSRRYCITGHQIDANLPQRLLHSQISLRAAVCLST